MARRFKSKVVKTIRHASGIEIPIALDRNEMMFVATVGDEVFEAKEADAVIAQATAYLDNATVLDWRPVIEINRPGDLNYFRAERYYLAKLPNGDWRKLDWDGYHKRSIVEPGVHVGYTRAANTEMEWLRISHLERQSENFDLDKLPCFNESSFHEEVIVIIAYTEEKFAALGMIMKMIEAMSEKLKSVLTTPEGIARLQMVGSNVGQLMAPTTPADGIRKRTRG